MATGSRPCHVTGAMLLHEVLATKREEILQRWKEQVRGTLAPEAIPTVELINHLPKFLSEIHSALREDAGLSAVEPPPQESTTAAGHGEQRLRLGFSLDSVVREYGELRDAIITVARETGAEITFRELQIVAQTIITGIAQAVSEYTYQRDAELLRQANEHFAFIAHELRNPLSSAMTSFDLLKHRGQLPTDSRAVNALERGLQRTSELIEQTLRIARVASGVEVHKQRTTISALFEDVEVGAASDAETKGVSIRASFEKDETIQIDVRLVRSALGNLLRNAVKFTPSGEVVELRAQITNGRVVIEVEDRCGGLPPGKVEEAFAPFVRLDSAQSGFGLGLAIAKQAVDAHGGSIRVQNLPSKGCIFVLEFPMT